MVLGSFGRAAAILIGLAAAGAALAGEPAQIRPGLTESSARADGGVAMALGLSRSVGYRVFSLTGPDRLVIDLADADLALLPPDLATDLPGIAGMRAGLFRPGWSRIVFDLDRPLLIESALLQNGQLSVLLRPGSAEAFAQASGAPPGALWQAAEPEPVAGLRGRNMQEGPVVIAIDPGHGGVDPGAIRGGVAEKDLALAFAIQLKEILERSGRYAVFMTREADQFVSLRDRVESARRANADVFLSIHANTVETGDVSGATIYSLSEEASSAAAQALADFENQSDIFAGADYQGGEDQVALALIDLARVRTDARSRLLGTELLRGLSGTIGVTPNHPFWSADLRVLQAPDMPSLLIELGFLSNEADRRDMQSAEWRERAAAGILAALDTWVARDRSSQGQGG